MTRPDRLEIAAQVDFERGERAKRDAWIKKVARLNPEMTMEDLGERFGLSPRHIERIVQR